MAVAFFVIWYICVEHGEDFYAEQVEPRIPTFNRERQIPDDIPGFRIGDYSKGGYGYAPVRYAVYLPPDRPT
ncbi:MAG: hypothetical protein ACRC7O_18030, partial [Fimbriiglobus sp.]